MQFDRLNRKLEGLEKASKNGHRVKDLYRMMYLPEIWQEAYANIYSNRGALTKGVDDVTLDGMSHERVRGIIEKLKAERYRFKPARRIHIPKKNGQRSLGIPSGDEKLVQEVARIILELNRLQYLSNYSLIKTLANKHKTKMSSILKQLRQGNEWIHKYRIGSETREVKVFRLKHMVME